MEGERDGSGVSAAGGAPPDVQLLQQWQRQRQQQHQVVEQQPEGQQHQPADNQLKGQAVGGLGGAAGADVTGATVARMTPNGAPAATAAGSVGGAPGSEDLGAKPKVVIVTGPTAVGKTAISLLLAQRLARQAGGGGSSGGDGSSAEGVGGAGRGAGGPACGGWGEVISADSVQVYRGLDVGSDKLPASERQGVPHHMIDVRDPLEDFSAGEFFESARPVAEDIIQRGGVPLVVGGTGLYLRWFVVGKGGAPRATPEAQAAVAEAMRAAWAEAAEAKKMKQHEEEEDEEAGAAAVADGAQGPEEAGEAAANAGAGCGPAAGSAVASAKAVSSPLAGPTSAAAGVGMGVEVEAGALTDEEKWEAAAALLVKWGDETAYSRIRAERNNYYRLERALCILAMHPGARLADFEAGADSDSPLDYDFRCFFLHRPRLQLYDRIALRVEEMVVGGGLLEEAALLLRLGLLPGQNMAGKAIGYRQAMEWLVAAKAAQRPAGLSDLCALHASICQATHKLVRAQMTWFRDDPMYKWVDVDGRDPRDVVEELLRELAKPQHEGGCGDSGRLSKEQQKAIMRYKPTLKLLTEAAAAGAAATAAAVAASTATAAAAQRGGVEDGTEGAESAAAQAPPRRPPKPKSKAALAAEAAAAAAAAAEAQLAPLLSRVNEVLLPGIPDAVVAAATAAAAAAGKGPKEVNAAAPEGKGAEAAGAVEMGERAGEGDSGTGPLGASSPPGAPDAKRPRPRPQHP